MKPYFLWDYDLSEKEVKKILSGGSEVEKLWLTGRILSHAHFRDVWNYLKVEDIASNIAQVRIPPEVRRWWEYALKIWGYHVAA